MASKRQFKANRANAKRSTGPKTTIGKARSSRNALRHGLARSETGDDAERLGTLLNTIASLEQPSSLPGPMDWARAQLRLSRIRDIRHGMLTALLKCPSPKQMKRLVGLERYERAARAECRRALRGLIG
jgi:hypothetical protein